MKVPETSIEAKELKTDESKQRDYDKIKSALLAIGQGHYEDIAIAAGVEDLNVISRRMKEMREMGIIEISVAKGEQEKKRTSRNRNAFVHKLCATLKSATKEPKRIKKKLEPNQKTITVRSYERRLKVKDIPDNQNKLF